MMFDDPKKELKRLEEELLKADVRDEEFEQFYQSIYEEFGPEMEETPAPAPVKKPQPKKSAYADAPRAVAPKKKKSLRGLVILVCLEAAGILAVIGWWMLKLL